MNVESSDAPYFVDLVKDAVQNSLGEHDLNEQGYRIYTTLDPDLQHAAAEAVSNGMKLVDEQVKKQRTKRVKVGTGSSAHFETQELPGPVPQVALVALDPHTGEVLALVGGRNYGFSQLNHAIAKRPTGSIFKPFVYAAAVNTALTGSPEKAFTPATLIDDSPTTFSYGDQIYEPRNYKNEYHGQVTARFALAESLNNATVKLAEMVGYNNVAELARTAGIASVRATPAMALGAYDATPLDMAGAYTVFANSGMRISPQMIKSVRARNGDMVQDYNTDSKPVLDPRVAYVMTSMMEASDEQRHRLHRPRPWIHRSRRRQDRHIARRMVCRIYDEPAVHRLGRIRRLQRPETVGRGDCGAHLGGVHEERRQVAAIQERRPIPTASGRGGRPPRQGHQPAVDEFLSQRLLRCLHRRHRAYHDLRPGRRPQLPAAHFRTRPAESYPSATTNGPPARIVPPSQRAQGQSHRLRLNPRPRPLKLTGKKGSSVRCWESSRRTTTKTAPKTTRNGIPSRHRAGTTKAVPQLVYTIYRGVILKAE